MMGNVKIDHLHIFLMSRHHSAQPYSYFAVEKFNSKK